MKIGKRLLETRKSKKGMSQRALAALAGVSNTTIARIEVDAVEPDTATIEKLATALGVSTHYLMGWTDDRADTVAPIPLGQSGGASNKELDRQSKAFLDAWNSLEVNDKTREFIRGLIATNRLAGIKEFSSDDGEQAFFDGVKCSYISAAGIKPTAEAFISLGYSRDFADIMVDLLSMDKESLEGVIKTIRSKMAKK